MKYNFRYDVDEFDNNEYQHRIKTHKHFNKNSEENDFKHFKKEKTKKKKKSRKEKHEMEDE